MAVTYRHVQARQDMLTGDILPKVDGTGAAAIPRFENIVALTSMVRDPPHWARPHEDPASYVQIYDKGNFTHSRRVIMEIHDACREHFRIYRSPDSFDQCGVLREDWSPATNLPVICTAGEMEDALVRFFGQEDVNLASCCDAEKVSRVLSGDDIRRPYYDLMHMKRFLMLNNPTTNHNGWGELKGLIMSGYQTIGPFNSEDGGKCIFHSGSLNEEWDGFYSPYFMISYDSDGNQESTEYIDGSYAFGVLSGYDRSFPMSGTYYLGNSLAVYVRATGTYDFKNDEGSVDGGGYSILYRLTSNLIRRITNRNHTLYGAIDSIYGIQFPMYGMLQLVNGYLSSRIDGWISRRISLSIGSHSIFVDSGIVKNYFQEIPESWTWDPPENKISPSE